MSKTGEITRDDDEFIRQFFAYHPAIVMDFYLLGRMFKKFSKQGYPGEVYQEFTKNNIILAGNSHIGAYKLIVN